MKNSINKILITSLLSYSFTLANDNNSIDSLLEDIKQKTDLSEKTKLENGGISYIYTREDLQKMQVFTLQDVLKTTYPFGYSENQYGIADPYSTNPSIPYMSSSIKIYIDNQELTTGFYGSGLSVYGNINIDFVDHIEVYSGNPTFEFSTEPAFTIIRLFSRSAIRDSGSKVSLVAGIDGENGISTYQADTLENNWSYFTFLSYLNNQRTEYENKGATLSRDTKDTHIFVTMKKDNQNIVLSGIISNKDSFMGGSVFATPDKATITGNYIHIGYDAKFNKLSLLATYDRYTNAVTMYDKNQGILDNFYSDVHTNVCTVGLTYNIKNNTNNLLVGTKYRYKYFKYNNFIVNNINLVNIPSFSAKFDHTNQNTATTFVENQYYIKDNKVITTGLSYSNVKNNNSKQDDNLYAYRVGYTYTNQAWVSKTTASYLENTLDPYMVNNDTYLSDSTKKINKEKKNVYMQNIKYKSGSSQTELVASFVSIKDGLMPDMDNNGLLKPQSKRLNIKSSLIRYTKEYNNYDKVELSVGYNDAINIPSIGHLMEHTAGIKTFNTYKRYDFYNEIIYYKNNYDDNCAFDYNIALSYHYSNDLLFSIKGINLFYDAHSIRYTTLNIANPDSTDNIHIPSIDKKILFSMEYTF